MKSEVKIRAYYNSSISNEDYGYQVNLMFFNNNEEDYFAEEFITTKSPKEAEELADKINKEGFENFLPQLES